MSSRNGIFHLQVDNYVPRPLIFNLYTCDMFRGGERVARGEMWDYFMRVYYNMTPMLRYEPKIFEKTEQIMDCIGQIV